MLNAPLAYSFVLKIVRTKRYSKDLKRLGASASDIAALEREVAGNPEVADVVPGLSGIRKMRFAISNRGKRGGGRAIYFVVVSDDVAVMLFAYAKNEREDLTGEQRKAALAIMQEFKDG